MLARYLNFDKRAVVLVLVRLLVKENKRCTKVSCKKVLRVWFVSVPLEKSVGDLVGRDGTSV